MPYVDVSYEGRQQAKRGQLDNGKLPHGGHRGSKRHPLMYLSFDKGRDFQDLVDQELARVLEDEELSRYGYTPSWSILLHKSPSYTDESVLMRNDLLAANKLEQSKSYDLFDPIRVESTKSKGVARVNGVQYYRPNRTHQYLTSTELRDFAETDVDIKYGRPTRTTLLRARQRSNSAPQERRDFIHHLEDLRNSAVINSNPSYLDLPEVRKGESLHSYLTGARYNRIHCLDAKSVDHSGVYMPRLNPAMGCFFSGPKGLWYIEALKQQQKAEADSMEDRYPVPPPASPRLQESNTQNDNCEARIPPLGFGTGQSTVVHKPIMKPEKDTKTKKHNSVQLNVTGKQLSISGIKLPALVSPKKPVNSEELSYRLSRSRASKSVAPETDDNRIKVEINQILAPTADSPTEASEVRDATEPPKKHDGVGQESSVAPEIPDASSPSRLPQHETMEEMEAGENIRDHSLESQDCVAVTNNDEHVTIAVTITGASDNDADSKDIDSDRVSERKDTFEPQDLETDAVQRENGVDEVNDREASPSSFHEALRESTGENEDAGAVDASEDVVGEEESPNAADDEDQGEKSATDVSVDKVLFFMTEDGFEEIFVDELVEDEL